MSTQIQNGPGINIVLGFIPSHLRKKKHQTRTNKISSPLKKTPSKQGSSPISSKASLD